MPPAEKLANIVEQTDRPVPLNEARKYVFGVPELLENRGANASMELCARDWEAARARTILSVLVRVNGDERRGTFVALGGRANSGQPLSVLTDVSLEAARRATVALASKELGADVSSRSGPVEWGRATRP